MLMMQKLFGTELYREHYILMTFPTSLHRLFCWDLYGVNKLANKIHAYDLFSIYSGTSLKGSSQ